MPRPKKKAGKVQRPSALAPTLKRVILFGSLAIVALFGFFGLFGENGLFDMIHLKSVHRGLTQEVVHLENEQEELRHEIAKLKDPRYVEFLARERLGLMGPGEVFIILDGDQAH